MKKHKIIIPFLALSLLLGGCGGSISETASVRNNSFADSYSMAQTYDNDSIMMNDTKAMDVNDMDENIVPDNAEGADKASLQNRKLIKNVSIEMESTDFDKTVNSITDRLKQLNGYVEYSNTSGHSISDPSESRYTRMKIRVPQDKLDEFLNMAETTGNVRNRTENITDITLQYADTEEHIKALETEQARLIELMEQADSIDAVIALESRLSEVRYQISTYASQMKLYDNEIDYSTVDLQIREVKIYTATDRDGVGARRASGFKKNCEFIKVFATDLFVFLVSNSILFAVIAVVFIFIIKLITISERRRKYKDHTKSGAVSPGEPKEKK